MSNISEFFPSRSSGWRIDRGRYISLILIAILLSALPVFGVLPSQLNAGVAAVGISFLVVVAIALARVWFFKQIEAQTYAAMAAFLEQQDDACIITDPVGEILVANTSANARLIKKSGSRFDVCLRTVFANPSAVILRLQSLAEKHGTAEEDIVTRGQTIPVSVSRLSGGRFCWRFKLDAPKIWRNVQMPVVTVGRNDVVLDANEAAIKLFGQLPESLELGLQGDGESGGSVVRFGSGDAERTYGISTLRHSGIVRDVLLTPFPQPKSSPEPTSFAALPVPIMCLTPQGVVGEANRLAVDLVGEIEPGTSNIENMMQGLGYPIRDWLANAAEQGAAPRSEFLRLVREDKEIFVQVTLSRILKDGQVCLIAVLNDATELKTMEAQFVQGQKMQAVGQLAGGVAHDFNNLLTAISGHCDLLLLRHDQDDPNYGDLVQINQNANRAAALVSQLLAFSRKQTLRPEVLDLRDTISDLIHLLNRLVGEKVRLTLSHDPVLKSVCADKRQLEQVLMNLVVNARDAMPEGGEIRIETEVINLDQPISRDRATVQPGEYVTVKVIDSGVGIPADKLQKVFEPFYTTKRTGEGTGLGLSTVYGIIKQTGGFIFVDSVQHKGTEFTVLLPVSARIQTPEPENSETPEEQGSRQGEGVVLLVEDEAPVRAFATRALRLKGYTVLEAESAEDALQLLDDPELAVDVFVTDVVMPGMDGPTWVRKAMQTRPDVRVVFMSGYTEGAFGESGPEIENSTFLPKPFSLTQLTEAVFQQIN